MTIESVRKVLQEHRGGIKLDLLFALTCTDEDYEGFKECFLLGIKRMEDVSVLPYGDMDGYFIYWPVA